MSSRTLILTLIFAMQFVFVGIANCQLIPNRVLKPIPINESIPVQESNFVQESIPVQQSHPVDESIRGNEVGYPFVAGHSPVPVVIPTDFESRIGCSRCRSGQPCDCQKRTLRTRYAACKYKYWGRTDLFCERPVGSYLRSTLNAQIAGGITAQMVLYQYDFFDADEPHADMLKLVGRRNLARIVDFLAASPSPIMIETTGDERRDAIRRGVVLTALVEMSVPMTADQIITIFRDSQGISGDEAISIHQEMMQQIGAPSDSGNSGGASTGTALGLPIFQ